ncbi:MAG: hypothetical protein PHP86_07775 [Nevskiales bacterium]|nr:hypothetical protein [Nevskiales bacterium]
MKPHFILLLPLSLSLFSCGNFGKFIYWVEASNDSQRGVVLLQVGEEKAFYIHDGYSKKGVDFPIIAALQPGIGGGTSVKFGTFASHKTSLPNEVEIVWQLADLTDCKMDEPNATYPGGRRVIPPFLTPAASGIMQPWPTSGPG